MSAIKVGDTVFIAKWPCCGYRLGQIFVIEMFAICYEFHCMNCGRHIADVGTSGWDGYRKGIAAPVSWLRKLPPLTEPETIETAQEVTA